MLRESHKLLKQLDRACEQSHLMDYLVNYNLAFNIWRVYLVTVVTYKCILIFDKQVLARAA